MCGVITNTTNVPAAPVITEPVNGSFDADGYVDVKGNSEPGTKISVFNGGVPIADAQAISKADGTFHLQIPFYTTGLKKLTVRAAQPDGTIPASAASASVTVDVTSAVPDTTPPTVAISMVPSFFGLYVYTNSPSVTGYASDKVGVVSVSVRFEPTNLFVAAATTGPTSYTANCTGCPASQVYFNKRPTKGERGVYDVYADAYDAAGNKGTSGPVVIHFLGGPL